MRRLEDAREHLDGELADQQVLVGNLRDLRRINRFFGGRSLSGHAIDRLAARSEVGPGALTLLDIGTGGADIPLALIEAWRRRGRELAVLAIDSRPEILAAASIACHEVLTTPGLTLRLGDGTSLPFEDRSFDIVHTSLVLHHLEPGDAVSLIREMARVARIGVVVNDLARGRFAWLGAWVLVHVGTRNRFTRHDGPLSVRRAYSVAEARDLLTDAGLRILHEEHAFMGHRWAIAAVPA
jgi:ubiquinone/menaquinone biosynthesis C-methylase UbiE